MAGVDALGGAVTWGEIGAIIAAGGSFATAVFGYASTKAKTEENSRSIEVLMAQMQDVRDKKATREELKEAVNGLKDTLRENKADLKDAITQVGNQVSNLASQVNNVMKSRAHSS